MSKFFRVKNLKMFFFIRLYEKLCYYFLGLFIYSMYGKKKKIEY